MIAMVRMTRYDDVPAVGLHNMTNAAPPAANKMPAVASHRPSAPIEDRRQIGARRQRAEGPAPVPVESRGAEGVGGGDFAHREHDATVDRMPISRYHPVGGHVRTIGQIGFEVDGHRACLDARRTTIDA